MSQCCDADGAVQVHKTVDLNSRNATVPAAQSSSVVLMGSYEEAQQNWLTPWLHGTECFLAGRRRHTLHTYLCETEYTGTGGSLKFFVSMVMVCVLGEVTLSDHALCTPQVVLMGSYEEWRSSTKLAPYSLTSRYWTFSGRYEKTHYICKTEHYTGTGSSLNFSCPLWCCVLGEVTLRWCALCIFRPSLRGSNKYKEKQWW